MLEPDGPNMSSGEYRVVRKFVDREMLYFLVEEYYCSTPAEAMLLLKDGFDEDCEQGTLEGRAAAFASGVEVAIADTHDRSMVDWCCV